MSAPAHRTATRLIAASAEQLFALYADVAGWKGWDEGLAEASVSGPFAVGTHGTLTLKSAPAPLPFELTRVEPNRGFDDVTRLGPTTVSFTHQLEPLSGGCRVTHTVTVAGADAEAMAERIGNGMKASLEGLSRLAEGRREAALGHVMLAVEDVAATADALEKTLGFRVDRSAIQGGYAQVNGPVPLGLVKREVMDGNSGASQPRGALPPPYVLGFVTGDVAGALARAEAAGAKRLHAPVTKPWGQVVALVEVVPGLRFELCTPW